MMLLLIGVVLWSLVHLYPALLPDSRKKVFDKLGEGPYKSAFTLGILAGVALIIVGWRSITPAGVYAPPLGPGPVPGLLVLLTFILFAASGIPGNIRRFIRHPQMTGTILWGVSHLLSNGSDRAILLFGGLTLWAILEIILINKRDGAWQKPEKAPLKKDVITIVGGVVVYLVVVFFHESLFGVSALPA
jgi:uncharacterized membrane protein